MKNYQLYPQFVLRTPAFSLNSYNELLTATESKMQDQYLLESFQKPYIRAAIYLASENIYQNLIKWEKGILKSEELTKTRLIFSKYLMRMCTRCTPFGLFAGCSTGEWGQSSNVKLKDISQSKKHTRLDMFALCNILPTLQNACLSYLRFYPNTSIYQLDGCYRFVEYHYEKDERIHELTALEMSPYLEFVLLTSKDGLTLAQLQEQFKEKFPDFEEEEISDFISSLIKNQFLVSELEPQLTGEGIIEDWIMCLKGKRGEALNQIIKQLRLFQIQLQSLNDASSIKVEQYVRFSELFKKSTLLSQSDKLLQTDYFRPSVSCYLNWKIPGKIRKIIPFLKLLNQNQKNTNLEVFRHAFYERYEGQSVPLMIALDPESGLAYPHLNSETFITTPFIDDIKTPLHTSISSEWDALKERLVKLYLNAIRAGREVCEVDIDDFKDLKNKSDDFPDSINVMMSLIGSGDNQKIHLKSVGGSSAVNLVNRFAHLDESLHDYVVGIAAQEKALLQEDELFAEIVHLPQSRVGNILKRQKLFDHELAYLAKENSRAQSIKFEDVYIRVRNNEFELFSKKLGKKINPRLSNAHNFSLNPMPVYHFLCDLQYQRSGSDLNFNWMGLDQQFSFLPRVVINDIILFKAQWRFEKADFDSLLNPNSTKLYDAFKNWCESHRLPKFVMLKMFDNELLLDLENENCQQILLMEAKRKDSLLLTESLFVPGCDTVIQDEGKDFYTNEVLFAFCKKQSISKKTLVNKPNTVQTTCQRSFRPGSKWLYYKVYLGAETADEIIKLLEGFVKPLMADGVIMYWFFIRYSDPDFHLRIRFFLTDITEVGKVMNEFKLWMDQMSYNKIPKIQLDTYHRELERYGRSSIALVEQMFYIDSKATMNFLQCFDLFEFDQNTRWYYALLAVNDLLDCFQLTADQKVMLFKELADTFSKEFGADKKANAIIKQKFRTHQKVIKDLLTNKLFKTPLWSAISNIQKDKNVMIQRVARDILDLEKVGNLEIDLYLILKSIIHMQLNRLFKVKQRKQEWITYEFLYKHFQSKIARQKQSKSCQKVHSYRN